MLAFDVVRRPCSDFDSDMLRRLINFRIIIIIIIITNTVNCVNDCNNPDICILIFKFFWTVFLSTYVQSSSLLLQ